LYESPHRIISCLEDLSIAFGAQRDLVLARELTKKFETVKSGSIEEILSWVQQDADQQRGEFVLMLGGKTHEGDNSERDAQLDKTLSVLLPHLPIKTVARCAAELVGVARKRAYDRALVMKSADIPAEDDL